MSQLVHGDHRSVIAILHAPATHINFYFYRASRTVHLDDHMAGG